MLTIVGIVLSVALISGLAAMGTSIKDNFLRNTIAQKGSFHVAYPETDSERFRELRNHVLVGSVGALREGTDAPLDEDYRIRVDAATAEMFRLLPFHLRDGRFPESPAEIVLEAWALARLPGSPGIGGSVTLPGAEGDPTSFAIVGVLDNRQDTQVNGQAAAYTRLDDVSGADRLRVAFTFREGVDISDHLPEFVQAGHAVAVNSDVLALLGESENDRINLTLNIIFGTLIGLVVLSTVAVIYNAFHIAVLERMRQFGLLRTIGASPGQIGGLVLREASLLAAIGIPLGLLCGWGALSLVLRLMTAAGFSILQIDDFQLAMDLRTLFGSAAIGLAAVYLAAWLPALRASRVSPVDAVRGVGVIARESIRRSRIPSPLAMAGIEGRMAAHNIRRNRPRFRVTTFSVVVSIALFVVFHYFAQESFDLTMTTNESDRTDFQIVRSNSALHGQDATRPFPDIANADELRRIRGIPGVAQVYGRYGSSLLNALVPEGKLMPDTAERIGAGGRQTDWNGERATPVGAVLHVYDEARLKDSAPYVRSGTADMERMIRDNGVLLVQTVKPYNPDEDKRELLPLTQYEPGDDIRVQFVDTFEDAPSAETVRQLRVAGILSESPFNDSYSSERLIVIVAAETYRRLVAELPPEVVPQAGSAVTGLDIALADEVDAEAVKQALQPIVDEIPTGRLIDIVSSQREARQFKLQMQIFIYGFLIVVGSIGSLNIINTVQTNLLLRRREFGLLQAVGMTAAQLRRMTSMEGVWYGVIGSVWGLAAGVGLCYFLFVQMNEIQGVPFRFPWPGALTACACAMAVGLLAVQGPMRRMSDANLVEELREEA